MAQPNSLTAGVRKVLHTAALFLCAFLFVRTFAVEPFGVPTGSMAGTFLGNHREASCPRCGYPVCVGDPGYGIDRSAPYADAFCPNCGQRGIDLTRTREIPGDRLLVDKHVFAARSPRRWEIAVFRCPVDLTKPYVKRVVGVPGEDMQIVGGDVFANGELLRKTLPQVREVAVPVFDLTYAPPGGWKDRWLVEAVADDPRLPADPSARAKPAGVSILPGDGTLVLAAHTFDTPRIGLTYRQWSLDELSEEPVRDFLGYNGPPRVRRVQPVHDFYFACEIEPTAGTGTFAVRLFDGADSVKVELPVEGTNTARLSRDGGNAPVTGTVRLRVGQKYRLEFALVDRRATVAIDGVEAFPPLDLPANFSTIATRGEVSRPLQLGARGAAVTLRDVRLLRDVHYRSEGVNGITKPHRLADDEYFLLGDNSGNSLDSREWKVAGVPERDFIGKPFLIHQPLKAGSWTVNGQTRTYQTVDWDRVKWLR